MGFAFQTTFDEERLRLIHLWFPVERSAKKRPDIYKMEAHAPARAGGKWRFVAYTDMLGETRRVELISAEPTTFPYDLAERLEQLYQLRLDFLLLSDAIE